MALLDLSSWIITLMNTPSVLTEGLHDLGGCCSIGL